MWTACVCTRSLALPLRLTGVRAYASVAAYKFTCSCGLLVLMMISAMMTVLLVLLRTDADHDAETVMLTLDIWTDLWTERTAVQIPTFRPSRGHAGHIRFPMGGNQRRRHWQWPAPNSGLKLAVSMPQQARSKSYRCWKSIITRVYFVFKFLMIITWTTHVLSLVFEYSVIRTQQIPIIYIMKSSVLHSILNMYPVHEQNHTRLCD